MDKQQKEIIREQIQNEIEKTNRSIEEYKSLIQPIAPDCAIGRVSRMDSIVSQEIPKRALKHAEVKLENLKKAKLNIDNPGFGVCARCGQDIPIGRILLVPHSKYCVNCAH